MASTWTCADTHTHDLSRGQSHIEPAATPGQECRTTGDRISAEDYAVLVANQVPKRTFTASTRVVAATT